MEGYYLEHINKILDFYKNGLSNGYENAIYKEGNFEEMVLQRLERAVKDEAFNNLLHSRYAIWSYDLINLIDAAKNSLQNHDEDDALQKLQVASNSIKAYKDILTVFDGESSKISDIFKGYAKHLLSIDNKNSLIINKEEIVRRLKKYSEVTRASLPRDIDFTIKNRVLKVFIKNAAQNMQSDSVAFEGWILILKHWLSAEIDYVDIDFETRDDLKHKYGFRDACHYNRFLYRLYNMSRFFPTWFFVNENKRDIVFGFINWLKSNPFFLNHSLQERKSVIETEKMERQVESWFVFHEGKELLTKHWKIDENKLFNQLPTGVFINTIVEKNAVFSRGASAIDMWGINTEEETLHLIELKCGNNKGLGVIGETLFYTGLIFDTCIAEESLFKFGKYGKAMDTSDSIAIKNNEMKFKHLNSHILAEKYHPLFTNEVEKLICDGLKNLEIEFGRATYSYTKKVLI